MNAAHHNLSETTLYGATTQAEKLVVGYVLWHNWVFDRY
jgi:hypothetical protein